MKKALLYFAICFFAKQALSKDVPKKEVAKVTYDFIGSIVLGGQLHNETLFFSTFLNFGGPIICVNYGKFGISYGNNNQVQVTPILGTGIQFQLQKFCVSSSYVLPGMPKNKK